MGNKWVVLAWLPTDFDDYDYFEWYRGQSLFFAAARAAHAKLVAKAGCVKIEWRG
ncbi:hypothetical protein [Zhongshania sp.]|uniref:hypothetical protein n=1 Tax=Zhongshania sp. TaxID=1971902 RepID=UPI00356777F1